MRASLVGTAWLTAAVLAALPAAAQNPNVPTPAEWDKVVAAARQEGTVALYTSDTATKCGPARIRAFEAKYGIKVQSLGARGSEIDERVRLEQTSGHIAGDVYINGGAAAYVMGRTPALIPHGPLPNLAHIKPQFVGASGVLIDTQQNLYSFEVNTSQLSEAEAPKRWTDLLDPKWKGKILSDDLRVVGGGLNIFSVLHRLYGKGFWEKMAQQDLSYDRDFGHAVRRVAQGEYLVYFPLLSAYSVTGAGLPVRYALPTDGNADNVNSAGIIKGGPHPNAARVLMNFYFEPDMQVACANEGGRVVIDGVDDRLEPFAKALAGQKVLGRLDYEQDKITGWINEAKAIFK